MVSFKQDMPPQGGFNPVEWAARAPKRLMGGFAQMTAFVGFTTLAWVAWTFYRANERAEELEMRDARLAVEPFLVAERDRAILKHYRSNRDEENALMKNVKGWKTGTLWGEPVYHNVRGRYIKPILEELLTHMSPKEKSNFLWDKLYR